MHFSTLTGQHGDKAYLESRLFYPTRGFQCLQFYHYNSGGDDDQLNIWVRVYTDDESKGDLRFVQTISGINLHFKSNGYVLVFMGNVVCFAI